MKRILLGLIAAIAVSAPTFADEALAKAKKCNTCHSIEKTKTGPSFKDLAKKYASQKDAPAKLADEIIHGKGTEMPANPQISEADAKTLVDWILSLK
jgi:cytochrome c